MKTDRKIFARFIVGLSLALIADTVTAQVPTNNCADPYWQDTLRCAAFPAASPQANLNVPPRTVSQVKDFTRVFLNENLAVRCLGGSARIVETQESLPPLTTAEQVLFGSMSPACPDSFSTSHYRNTARKEAYS